MKLAVIILNWNGREIIKQYLPSVVANTHGPEVELIVADNGSSDGSVEWLRENFPDVRIVAFSENYGFAGGYDRAIREVDAEYTLLLNSDVETPEGWWQPLLEFMEKTPYAGAVQPKILSYRDKRMFEHAGAAGGLIDALGYPYARGRIGGKVERDTGQYDDSEAVEVAWASGAAMLVRTKAYYEAGGLDLSFFAHMEEIDLCWRMMLAGYKIYAVSDSVVYHYGGGSLSYGNPRKTYLNFRNNLLMLHKNLPRKEGKKFLLRRRLVDTLAFSFFLMKGKWGDARAVVRAHRDFKKMRGSYSSFPEKDILKDMPGADRYIYLPFKKKKRNATEKQKK